VLASNRSVDTTTAQGLFVQRPDLWSTRSLALIAFQRGVNIMTWMHRGVDGKLVHMDGGGSAAMSSTGEDLRARHSSPARVLPVSVRRPERVTGNPGAARRHIPVLLSTRQSKGERNGYVQRRVHWDGRHSWIPKSRVAFEGETAPHRGGNEVFGDVWCCPRVVFSRVLASILLSESRDG
jgi:hypothetical protein